MAALLTRMFGSARHGQPNAEVFIFRVESTYAGLPLTLVGVMTATPDAVTSKNKTEQTTEQQARLRVSPDHTLTTDSGSLHGDAGMRRAISALLSGDLGCCFILTTATDLGVRRAVKPSRSAK